MRDHADVIQREVALLLTDVGQLVDRVADLERHFALSGRALENISSSTTKILGRQQRLTSLDLEAMQRGDAGALPPPAGAPHQARKQAQPQPLAQRCHRRACPEDSRTDLRHKAQTVCASGNDHPWEFVEMWVLGTSPRMTVLLRDPDYFATQSAHLAGAPPSPHGLIGTAEVEFSGLPSMSLSV
ncbi:MAG: hypothetical protein WDN31_22005 [Hyphomicrobium sp.]